MRGGGVDINANGRNLTDYSRRKIIITLPEILRADYKLKNLDKIKTKNSNFRIENNTIILTPIDNPITIILPIEGCAKSRFNFELFVIIAIISYFGIFLLTNYLANFKVIQGKSRIEIIFLTIFFILLFIPMINISQDEISHSENRTLAKWHPLITKKREINYNFGRNFDNWYNDRFFTRKELIDFNEIIHYFLSYKVYETDKTIINKKSGFCYTKKGNTLNMYLNKNLFSPQQLNTIIVNFKELSKQCKRKNIKLYIVLENDKESIYPEYYPKYYIPKKTLSRIEQLSNSLKNVEELKVIRTKENLLKLKKTEPAFRKTDTHNTILTKDIYKESTKASFIQYNTIINTIKKDYPLINPVTSSYLKEEMLKDQVGDIIKSSYLKKYYKEDEKILYLKAPNSHIVQKKHAGKSSVKIFKNPKSENNLKLLVIGDSFTTRYICFFAETFESVTHVMHEAHVPLILEPEINEILKENEYDIIIIESTERYLQKFLKTKIVI